MEYVIPETVYNNTEALGIYNATMKIIQESYDKLISLGIRAEDARYVFPNAAQTNLIVSMNLRAFMEFYNKRKSGTHAQAEIQQLAELLRTVIEESEPWTKELFN
jgi:thymidylate synthase (FAD)